MMGWHVIKRLKGIKGNKRRVQKSVARQNTVKPVSLEPHLVKKDNHPQNQGKEGKGKKEPKPASYKARKMRMALVVKHKGKGHPTRKT
jgi:hypothetical protein